MFYYIDVVGLYVKAPPSLSLVQLKTSSKNMQLCKCLIEEPCVSSELDL